MKNIHVLPTDKQIKNVGDLVKDQYGDIHIFTKNDGKEYGKTTTELNIYITSDEEIKEGDWIFDIVTKKNEIAKFNHNDLKRDWKKIILTTDQDLIKDGVQAIDDEFLEWFVKNPSCERVDIEELISKNGIINFGYKVNDEQTKCYCGHTTYCDCGPEESKQETAVEWLEQEIFRRYKFTLQQLNCQPLEEAIQQAKEMEKQQQCYSEEDLEVAFFEGRENNLSFKEWFEQFKKK